MKKPVFINGFSRMDKKSRIEEISSVEDLKWIKDLLAGFEADDPKDQQVFDSISENTVSNFHLPYGIAPNFKIDDRMYHVPMVVEESSVIAAASKSAKFWCHKGGFQTVFLKKIKTGQIHFIFEGDVSLLKKHLKEIEKRLRASSAHLTTRMNKRGGGIKGFQLQDFTAEKAHYFQLMISFDTADSMGANFINSCLEAMAAELMLILDEKEELKTHHHELIMAILSNYTPESIIRMKVETSLENLDDIAPGIKGSHFAEKFAHAVHIARHDIYRATTHNKGIMNGVDAVIIATGNDFRAVEAGAHAYAARNGRYASLSEVSIEDGLFRYELELPLSVGTVGGLTSLHPLAAFSIRFLGEPGADELMKIIAAAGLANNFGAIRSLITEGIQKGHMKLHLDNILTKFNATEKERIKAKEYFSKRTVSYSDVKKFLNEQRN
ncbi:MAG: hydroxymethylglutaryl-CoA reductase, degradative [Bacteroidota bacterium]